MLNLQAPAELAGRFPITAPLRVLPALNEVTSLHPVIVIDSRLSDEPAEVVDG